MKKIIALMLVLALAGTMLCACGDNKKDNGKEKLVMATNAEFPPYEYHEGNDIVGIDVEVAQALAEKLDMELEIKDMNFDSIITAVDTGKADVGLAGMTVTPEREKNVDFSDSYATGVQVVIVREDSAIKTVDDLMVEGKKVTVGVQTGTTGDIYTTDDIEKAGYGTVKRYPKGADGVAALSAGKIDCVVIDNQPAMEFVKANKGLKILDTEYAVEDYAIVIKKGNTELTDSINNALKELKEDGTIQAILDKYIKAE